MGRDFGLGKVSLFWTAQMRDEFEYQLKSQGLTTVEAAQLSMVSVRVIDTMLDESWTIYWNTMTYPYQVCHELGMTDILALGLKEAVHVGQQVNMQRLCRLETQREAGLRTGMRYAGNDFGKIAAAESLASGMSLNGRWAVLKKILRKEPIVRFEGTIDSIDQLPAYRRWHGHR